MILTSSKSVYFQQLIFLSLYGINCQFVNRYVNFQQRYQCQFVNCGFGTTCDLSYQACWNPPCRKTVGCVSDFSFTRSGTCPGPSEDRRRTNNVECFTDAGCFPTQRCCHTFSGTYCYTPSVMIG